MVSMFAKDVVLVPINDDDDLQALLDRADNEPLVLERNGVRYVLNREDTGVYYDPAAAREAMRTAGKLKGVTAEEMLEVLEQIRGRKVGSDLPVGS